MPPETVADAQLRRRLRELFAEELHDGVQVLTRGLLSLEAGVGATAQAELVRELFRAAHSLKGAAHAAGFPQAVGECDALETTLVAVRDGDVAADAELVTHLLERTDVLVRLAAQLQGASEPATEPEPEPAPDDDEASPPPGSTVPAPAPRVVRAAVPSGPAGSGVRVTVDKIDDLFEQAGESLTAARRLTSAAGQALHATGRVHALQARLRSAGAADDVQRLVDEVARAVRTVERSLELSERVVQRTSSATADAVQRLRMQPFTDVCAGLDRVVRDVATSGGKQARLRITGGDFDLDRAVVAALRDPLLHLVRNAVDHGIEPPAVRAAAGKAVAGTVEVVASLEGGLLTVVVRDDGGGVDVQRLRDVAASRGLTVPGEDVDLPFVPGLSSRTDVTSVSGRGVGLDAARDRLEQLGGSLEMVSRVGGGTDVVVTSPVSLALMRVLLLRTGGQAVAVPTSSVRRVEQVDRRALRVVEGSVLLPVDGTSTRAVSLAAAIGLDGDLSDSSEELAVVVPRGGDAVLLADAVLDELEAVVQPVPARLAGAVGVLGVAVVDSALPTLVVNPAALGRDRRPFVPAPTAQPRPAAARILLAEDTLTTRALERSILEAAGYSVAVAVDGADAWEQLQSTGADLVVSDVDMPRMTGFELCRTMRSSARFREVPVVLVTSLDSEADRRRGVEAGADAYVVKAGFEQGALLDAVARLL